MTCQVNFSLMFPYYYLGWGGRIGFWGVRKAFLLTNGQFFREIKTFISICHFFTVEFYIMNYFYGQLVFVCWHSSCLRFIYSGNETKTSLGPVDQLLFSDFSLSGLLFLEGLEGLPPPKINMLHQVLMLALAATPLICFFEDPKTDVAYGILYLRLKLLKS